MIQRIQSLWLFLAAMMNGLLFILPLYAYGTPETVVGVRNNIPLLLVAAIITVLPLLAVFFFGNRPRQRGMVWLSIIGILGFFALTVMEVGNQTSNLPPNSNVHYAIPGILVTVVAFIFLILALRGIRKDDKLIKSLDRLR